VHDALELLQHLLERFLRAHQPVNGLQSSAQLLGVLSPLPLALHGRLGVQPQPLAGDRLTQGVHDLPSMGLVLADRASHGGKPTLDVAQQAIDVQLGTECTPARQ